jgi:ppGpp synthetase/RelA/SpoT-type nucleotidyltranferase
VFQELGIERVREIEAALKRQQGDLDSVEAMVQRANTVNPSFQANIDSVAKSVGGKKADKFINLKDGSQFDVEVKTPKSIATKVERKGLAPADFTDGVRTTIYIDTADQAEEAVSQIGQMYTTIDRGWQRIPESGYFDRKMNVLVDDPATGKKIVAEIQIKTPEMFDAGEQGAHRWYDYSRKLEGRYNHEIPGTKLKLYNKALAEQRRLFGAAFDAADPAIVEQLVDKFMKGGVVEAGPQSFRISFQNWA